MEKGNSEQESTRCKNCETIFKGRYCPACAQSAEMHRLTVPHIAHELVHAVTHMDKGILHLAKEMALRPGIVVADYVAGKRKRYYNPFSYLLLAIALQLFIAHKTHIYDVYSEAINEKATSALQNMGSKGSASAEKAKKTLGGLKERTSKTLENNKLVNMLCIPLISFLSWLFFRRSKYNYAENLLLNGLLTAQVLVFFLVFIIIPFLLFPGWILPLMLVYLAGSVAYFIWSYKQFFKYSWAGSIWRGLLVQVIFMLAVDRITDLLFRWI